VVLVGGGHDGGGYEILRDAGGNRRNVIVVQRALPVTKTNVLSEMPPVSSSVKTTSPVEKVWHLSMNCYCWCFCMDGKQQ
jgi:hypothetical protein